MVYFISTNNGINLTFDSYQYIKVAQQIYQNGFISIIDNEKFVYWPPLYPLILSFLLDAEGHFSIIVFQYLLGLCVIFIWNIISKDILKNKIQQFLFIILLSLSTNMLMISTFIWSELLFLLLFSLVILIVKKYLNTRNIYWILLSIIPAFLMLIQRNVGIIMFSAFYFSIVVLIKIPVRHFKILGLSYFISISGIVAWNGYKILIEDRLYIFCELFPVFTPLKNIILIINEIGVMFYPATLLLPITIFFTSALFIICSYCIFYQSESPVLKILLLTTIIYLSFWIIISGNPSEMSRFLSVITPLLLLSMVRGTALAMEKLKFYGYIKTLIFSIIILYSVVRVTNNSFLWGGYNNYLNFVEILNISIIKNLD